MNEEVLKAIISMLAEEILLREYAKDMRHEEELMMLRDGEFERFEAMKRGDYPRY